jgi:hypothetical protein
MNLAPIAISTYARREHLGRTLDALARNTLARQSELFIFSDAPKPGDEHRVAEVRAMLVNIAGFKNVYVTERETNNRVYNNRQGIRSLLEEYGRCIFLEEDIVTAPGFLSFMNKGLEHYREDPDVFAICGYTPPVQVERYCRENVFLCPRFAAWGFGIWADRFRLIEEGPISQDLLSPPQLKRLRYMGTDLLVMLQLMSEGELEALDVRINFSLARDNLHVVNPTRSLTFNTGHDGTGMHCGISDYFDTPLDARDDVAWNFERARRYKRVERLLFHFRGQHPFSIKNLIRYYAGRYIDFQA